MYIPGTTYLHILLHCTLYLIAHLTPYFIPLFVSYLILTIFVYIYTLSCFLFHSFFIAFMLFFFFILLSCFIFLSCTFHWADLSRLTFHYLLYPVWLCMWQIIKNLEPWTLNLKHKRLREAEMLSACWVNEIVWNTHSMTTQTDVSSSEQPDSALRMTETWIKYVNSYCANAYPVWLEPSQWRKSVRDRPRLRM